MQHGKFDEKSCNMRENPSRGALQESEVNRFDFVKIVLNLQTKLVKNY